MNGRVPAGDRTFGPWAGATAWTVSAVLLWASFAGLVGHDHAAAVELAGYHCSASHDGAGRSPEPDSSAHVHRSGPPHQHQCLGCKLSAQRTWLDAVDAIAADLSLPPAAIAKPISLRRSQASRTGTSLRGPPLT